MKIRMLVHYFYNLLNRDRQCIVKYEGSIVDLSSILFIQVYRVYVNKQIIDDNTLTIFRACIGNRIDTVVLESLDSRAHPVISKIFEMFKFNALEVIARPLSQNDV